MQHEEKHNTCGLNSLQKLHYTVLSSTIFNLTKQPSDNNSHYYFDTCNYCNNTVVIITVINIVVTPIRY